MIKKILNVVFWVVIIGLMIVWLVDFFQIKSEKSPKFCLKNVEHSFEDGSVKECVGLGYKIYTYERTSLKGVEFVPFFIKMRES